jgi:hypothetical protein
VPKSLQAGVLAGDLQDYWAHNYHDPSSQGGKSSSAGPSYGGGRATFDFEDPFAGAL